jgi:hypothetical protein
MRRASQFERFDAPRHFLASFHRSGRGREQRASGYWRTDFRILAASHTPNFQLLPLSLLCLPIFAKR